ncbi:sigma-70 family RNA polymerase sigma factor [Pelagicoccus sp. NFK12]|uniref:Sigma-70 family RNA polymerase sigma factor n=1 Tax=Pelagicoccus enzymogenes TaxID=2773457 RepID=A0A927F4M6_9BACT|nr:sigma-70 family RNA polymerase sigma factor [Pelagicoccus enzymogenes]MBD5778313.1 sigma-70 family RNA polymerase sigma factor [Pelagicoccus enzymogenes]MDQ8199661.1 sigma-70 family RNA polymerase sigma factor [Pelagicoccus enzymogenes]
MPSDNETDLALLEALRRGRDTALNELMVRWQRPFLSFAYRYVQSEEDARDLVEELFVRVYKNRDRFKEGTKFSAWAFTSLSNLCKNFERWRRRHPAFGKDSLTDDMSKADRDVHPLANTGEGAAPDEEALRRERIEIVKDAINKLPHDLRVTLLLYQYEGLSYKEIGEVVGCSVKGVETRLYRARKALKAILCSKIGPSGDIWGEEE